MQTHQSDRTRHANKYVPYGDNFVVERTDLKKIVEDLGGLEEIIGSQEVDTVDDLYKELSDRRPKSEVEIDNDQQQSYEQEVTNLCILEWLNQMTSDSKETSVTIQDVDRESMKYINNNKHDPSWAAQEGPLFIPVSNRILTSGMRSTGMSMEIFVREWG